MHPKGLFMKTTFLILILVSGVLNISCSRRTGSNSGNGIADYSSGIGANNPWGPTTPSPINNDGEGLPERAICFAGKEYQLKQVTHQQNILREGLRLHKNAVLDYQLFSDKTYVAKISCADGICKLVDGSLGSYLAFSENHLVTKGEEDCSNKTADGGRSLDPDYILKYFTVDTLLFGYELTADEDQDITVDQIKEMLKDVLVSKDPSVTDDPALSIHIKKSVVKTTIAYFDDVKDPYHLKQPEENEKLDAQVIEVQFYNAEVKANVYKYLRENIVDAKYKFLMVENPVD